MPGFGGSDELRDLRRAIDRLADNVGAGDGLAQAVGTGGAQGGGNLGFGAAQGTAAGRGAGARGGQNRLGSGLQGVVGGFGFTPGSLGAAALTTSATKILGRGFMSHRGGGNLIAGAASGFIDLAAKVPLLGEMTGAAPTSRTQGGALARMNAEINDVARYGGANAVTPEFRGFMADLFIQQEKNVERSSQMNRAAIDSRLGGASQGEVRGAIARTSIIIGEILAVLKGNSSGAKGGGGRHT